MYFTMLFTLIYLVISGIANNHTKYFCHSLLIRDDRRYILYCLRYWYIKHIRKVYILSRSNNIMINKCTIA